MKKATIQAVVISLLLAFGATVSAGVELAYIFGWNDSIYRTDTETGSAEAIYDMRMAPSGIDSAPDGKIYSVTCESGGISEDPSNLTYLQYVKSITPSPLGGGYGDETIVYTDETDRPRGGDMDFLRDVAVKTTDGSGSYEVYYSIASGYGGVSEIYRVDGPETATLYYTVNLADVPVPSCNGTTTGTWAGDFAFDDADNLYLSSGNHHPASIFRIDGAGRDRVTGSPVEIYSQNCSIMGLCYESPDSLYFADHRSSIYRLDLTTQEAELVYTSESVEYWMEDVALLSGRVAEGRMVPSTMSMLGRFSTAPDLRVTEIHVYDPTFKDGGRQAAVPLFVTIKNFGISKAETFEVGITALYPGQKREVEAPFSAPGKVEGLESGEEVTLPGTLTLAHPDETSLYGQNISISAHADSCFGYKAMPDYCRVMESDETNNDMAVELKLPTVPLGGLTPISGSLTKR